MSRKLVMFVPGILGTVLSRSGETIWPPQPASLINQKKYLKKLVSADQIGDPVQDVYCQRAYGQILENLRKFSSLHGDQNIEIISLGYDWRKSVVDIATELDAEIAKIVAHHKPVEEIIFLAHSMGGLVVRTMLESNRLWKGWRKLVKSCVFVATPHNGAPKATASIMGLAGTNGLSAKTVRAASENGSVESLLGLLPPAHVPYVQSWTHEMCEGINELDLAILNRPQPVRRELSHWKVLEKNKRPNNVRYFCVANSNVKTPSSVMISRGSFFSVESEKYGDGTVPIYSAFLTQAYNVYAPGNHMKICGARRVIEVLELAMGLPVKYAPFSSADIDSEIMISVTPDNVTQMVPISIDVWSSSDRALDFRLVELLRDDETTICTRSLPPMTHTSFELEGLDRGWYRAFVTQDGIEKDSDAFFVSAS